MIDALITALVGNESWREYPAEDIAVMRQIAERVIEVLRSEPEASGLPGLVESGEQMRSRYAERLEAESRDGAQAVEGSWEHGYSTGLAHAAAILRFS